MLKSDREVLKGEECLKTRVYDIQNQIISMKRLTLTSGDKHREKRLH